MNEQQEAQQNTIQNGNYTAKVEDGKITLSAQKQQPSEDSEVAAKLKKQIGTEVNDLKLLYLLNDGKGEYKDMDFVKSTRKDVADFVSHIRRLKEERYDRDYIASSARKKAKVVIENYKENATKNAQKLQQWQNQVKQRFEQDKLISNAKFENPQEEILKRQNFTTKLEAMNNKELNDYIQELTPENKLTDFELNTLLARAKDNDTLRNKLKHYEKLTRKSYTVLPEWQNVAKLYSFANMRSQGDTTFYYDENGHGTIFNPSAIIFKELKGYTVTDRSQRYK